MPLFTLYDKKKKGKLKTAQQMDILKSNMKKNCKYILTDNIKYFSIYKNTTYICAISTKLKYKIYKSIINLKKKLNPTGLRTNFY